MRVLLLTAALFFCNTLFAKEVFAETKKLKVLHLTFHKGCQIEIENIAKLLSLDLTTWFIHDLPSEFFDGCGKGSVLYNIGHERAEHIWTLHQDFFESFDVILTSDTAPLARIFLQNGWEKPLIIWICNRFDYCDAASLDCDFPDAEFYSLMDKASRANNVHFVAYTAFEHYYTKSKGIDTGSLIITPCGFVKDGISTLPQRLGIDVTETFVIPTYHNETIFMDLSKHLTDIGIKNWRGRYESPLDLKDFKGIICLPYSWSNLALFENFSLGIPYFIPSRQFFKELAISGDYFHPNLYTLLQNNLFDLSEWYCPERKDLFVYFDSWDDLKSKIKTTDYELQRMKIKEYSKSYSKEMLARWNSLFAQYR